MVNRMPRTNMISKRHKNAVYGVFKRGLALLLCLCIMLSMVDLAIPVVHAGDVKTLADIENIDSALHFYIRHWHNEESDALYQDDSDNFVVIEGYIVPTGKDGTGPYEFYFVDQGTGEIIADGLVSNESKYITEIDEDNGIIVLNENSVTRENDDGDEEDAERFSGFSVSAGHKAVSFNNTTRELTISYKSDVHLVKGHVFYIAEIAGVDGSSDNTIFGSGGLTQANPEVDTAIVYTYKEGVSGHQNGEIVLDNSNMAVEQGDTLPEGVNKNDVQLTKFYSTTRGLHTDKTASVIDYEDRIYNLKLEAWYSQAQPEVGLILDASGSMAFASDKPTEINAKKILEAAGKWDSLTDAKKGRLTYTYAYPKYDALKGYYPFTVVDETSTYTVSVDESKLTLEYNDDFFSLPNVEVRDASSSRTFDGTTLTRFFELNNNNRDISFKVSGNTTIKIWWANPTSGSDRGVLIQNAEGDTVKSETVTDTNAHITTHEFTGDGNTYKLLAVGGTVRVYRVEISTTYSTTGLDNKASDGSAALVEKQNNSGFSFEDAYNGTVKPTINDNGFNLKSGVGLKLDTVPGGDSFTVSFALTRNGGQTGVGEIDLLYIGAIEPKSDNDYIRITHQSNSNSLFVYQGESVIASNIGAVADNSKRYVTIVYENNTLYFYVYNPTSTSSMGNTQDPSATIQNVSLSDFNIILGGFANNYSGNDIYIDDLFVYDAALTAEDVNKHCNAINSNKGINDKDSITVDSSIFLSAEELSWILNIRNTDNSLLGVSDYTYFVFDTADTSMEYAPLGYWGGTNSDDNALGPDGNNLGELNPTGNNRSNEAGWYFISHTSTWDKYTTNPGTGKQLRALKGGTYTDSVTLARDGDAGVSTGVTWTVTESKGQAIKFYIDNAGYLRCFYNNGSTALCSYVYELSDSQYVKTEALQRALGSFVTKLSEKSPGSLISAVRFSTANATSDEQLSQLVLLDWTNDAGESAGILSLTRGSGDTQGTTLGSTTSSYLSSKGYVTNGIEQYNYGLTGGTTTYLGLKAFNKVLAPRLEAYETTSGTQTNKYIILFTDGLDTDRNNANSAEAEKIANQLKAKGYTVFAVILAGGLVKEGSSQYTTAMSFLETVADYVYYAENVDELTDTFTNDILDLIAGNLRNYTVTDYIDPRFDLQDADGTLYELNANGIVNGIDVKTTDLKIHIDASFDEDGENDDDYDARWPYLRYDSSSEMYYLEWTKQTVPVCAVGADKLEVWEANVIVQAKEDFIGGNDILSNGQAAKMNYLYYSGDKSPSSGTEDMYKKYKTRSVTYEDDNGATQTVEVTDYGSVADYPSKGFPRTTVNVKLLELLIENREQYIYLSEDITPDRFVEKLGDTIKETYYWEYLERYFKTSGAKYTSLEGFIKALVESNNGIDLPYSYLLNTDGTNQTGKTQPGDVIGVLHYQWDMVDPNDSILGAAGVLNENSYGGTNRLSKSDKFQTLDTRTVKYRLTVSYYPYPNPDDPLWIEADDFTDSLTELDNYISALKDDLSDIEGVIEALKSAKDDMAELALKYARGELTTEQYEAELDNISSNLTSILQELADALEDDPLPKHIKSLKESIDTLQENPDIPDELNSILKSLANDLNALTTATGALNEAIAAVDSNGAASLKELYSKLNAFITVTDGLESPKNAFVEDANDCEAFIEYISWCVKDSHLTARDTENAELITEEDYGPVNGNFPKAAVGSSQYEKTVYGSHTTEIVRGELSFELELGMSDMNYQFGWHWSGKEEITYTVDVTPEGERHEELPELTITITKEDLAKLKERADNNGGIGIIYYFDVEDYVPLKDFGLKSQYTKAIYDSSTGKVTYYSDPRVFTEASDNDYATLLPKGTYTLTPSSKNARDWYMFDIEFGYAAIVDYERADSHFKDEGITSKDSVYSPRISTGSNTENNYAPRGTENDGFEIAEAAKFYLGTEKYADGETYLNARVGMAKVTGTMRYELPATGGEGTTRFLIWGSALLLTGMALAALMLLSRNYPRFRRVVRFK